MFGLRRSTGIYVSGFRCRLSTRLTAGAALARSQGVEPGLEIRSTGTAGSSAAGRRFRPVSDALKIAAAFALLTSEVADVYAVLGDTPKALEWLDQAVRNGDERAEWFRRDPMLANIREHPRFQQILDAVAARRKKK